MTPVSETSADQQPSEELERQADAVADFLEELLERMGIDAIAEPSSRGDHMYVDIVEGPEEDLSLLLGREGQTLDAIQELTRMAVGRQLDERVRVVVDVADHKKRQEDRLAAMGRAAAERALESGEEVEMEPMNSYERKIVHDAVATVDGVESSSRGEDPNRFVVIRRS
jgi:spoIIIJ-associated protein